MKKFLTFGIIGVFSILILNISKAEELRICTMDYNPVCGTNGITYGNACGAGNNPIAYKGECTTPTQPVACTKEYAPVCGEIQVQCFTTPCPPIAQTYGNSCMMKAANATLKYTGECKDINSIQYQKLSTILDSILANRNIIISEAKKEFVQQLLDKVNYTMMVSTMLPRQNQLYIMLKDFLQAYIATL